RGATYSCPHEERGTTHVRPSVLVPARGSHGRGACRQTPDKGGLARSPKSWSDARTPRLGEPSCGETNARTDGLARSIVGRDGRHRDVGTAAPRVRLRGN